MAKKNKRNLQQRLKKKQQLQQTQTVPEKPTVAAVSAPKEPSALLPSPIGSRELWRTIFSLLLIALLLGATVAFDRQNNYLDTFGNWIYNSLRLDS